MKKTNKQVNKDNYYDLYKKSVNLLEEMYNAYMLNLDDDGQPNQSIVDLIKLREQIEVFLYDL